MKFKIKNRRTGKVIFEHDTEENSMRATIEAAIAAGIDLRSADLNGAYLCGSNLRDVDFGDVDLGDANLSGADLRDAYLGCANLGGADLRGADLRGAYLDFSTGWKFSRVHSSFKVSVCFAYQVLAHLCSCESDDPEFTEIREKILPYALKSHRAEALGLLKGSSS